MKFPLCILAIALGFAANAKNYYISNSGNDLNSGTDPSTPWQTISQVNKTKLNPGDQVLFKRGDTFYGSVQVNNSGTSVSPIIFGAYGMGARPIITGFTSVSSWTNLGNNIWESSNAVSSLPTLKQVVINNITIPMGATPNRDNTYPFLPNYFTFQSHTGDGIGSASVTSSNLTDGRNWTGADVVVRVNHWTLDKETIISQSGSTINYVTVSGSGLSDGWGFWIQNDPRTLDVQNEWYYNPKTKKMRIYSTSPPTGVKITGVDTLFYASNKDYITVDNLDFEGANISAVVFSSCDYPTITNCNLSYTGATALEAQNKSNYLLVNNCSFSDLGGAGIWNSDGGTNWVIINNTFKRCDLVSVIKPNDYSNGAIEIISPNALVQYNYIDSTGYEGIHFRGNNVQIRNNFVNHTTILRDDGGGIYTGFTNETGKIIDGNIVLNSIGNDRGVASGGAAGNGIYLDGLTDDATVTNNTIAHVASAGIFLNNGRLNSVHNNTIYDIGGDNWTKGCLMVQTYNGTPYSGYQRGNNVTNNIFFQKKPSQIDLFYYTASDKTNTIQDFGILDSNYYAKAMDTSYSIIASTAGSNYQNLQFAGWQSLSGKEVKGKYYNKLIDSSNIKFVYNPTKNDSLVLLNGIYKDVKGAIYKNGSITIPPFRSAILIYDSPLPLNDPPVPYVGPDRVISLPKDSIVLSGNAKDSDGIIISYRWNQLSGPTQATIINADSAIGGAWGLIEGIYQFQLTVTDNEGATASAILNVTVNATNNPPTANAGNDQIITLPTNSTTLSGSGTDEDGTIATYQWAKISGPDSETINNANSSSATLSNLSEGTYQFQLTVTDNKGAIGKDTMQLKVNAAPNVAPTADAGTDKAITLPTNSVNLSGSGIDEDGTIASYQWAKISGPDSGTINNANSSSATLGNLSEGTYQFQLTVTDNKGAIGKDTMLLKVNAAPNVAPTADAGTDKAITLPTNSVSLSGSGIDEDGTIATYQWAKISGPDSGTINNANSSSATLSDLSEGTYQFQLTVTDNEGAIGKDTMQVKVNAAPNIAPTANAGSDKAITLPTNSVSLSGSGADEDGTISSFQWTKISGPASGAINSANSSLATLSNLSEGTYQFQLTVTDNEGAIGKDTMQVKVNAAPNIAPTANAGSDKAITLPTNSVSLSGSGADEDGTISSFQWAKISGPASGEINSANSSSATLINLSEGTYQFQLTVTDNQGAIGKDTMQLKVNAAPNIAPTANAGNDKAITLPTNSVSFSGSGADEDGTIASYQWTKISGPASGAINSANSSSATLINLSEGTYQFQLTVTDNQGAIGKDTVQVKVNAAPNIAPTANAGSDTTILSPASTVILNGKGVDNNGEIAAYSWKQISGPSASIINLSNTLSPEISELKEGTYEFEFLVRDYAGAVGKDSVKVTVALGRLAPEINTTITVYPNPVHDLTTVDIHTGRPNTNILITITDIFGKTIYKKEMISATDNLKEPINMTNFSNGAYVVTIFCDNVLRKSVKILKL